MRPFKFEEVFWENLTGNKLRNFTNVEIIKIINISHLPLRFRKVGRVWCGGARETRKPRVTIG